ncbi:hypothetical protein POVCU1_035040 [Plasmodium ovale curtisi]|uniref:Uncharacterized protein n=1 Tax=Plasmodium ovale curtisi TaxID=864141 RepID=A0A1A8WVL7_PLAOA|nr:hypothetical protein POVCU1_035040 [Plasmodium ovale curtisi]
MGTHELQNGDKKWSLCKNDIPTANRISFRGGTDETCAEVGSRRREENTKRNRKCTYGENENIGKGTLSKSRHRRGRETCIGGWSSIAIFAVND